MILYIMSYSQRIAQYYMYAKHFFDDQVSDQGRQTNRSEIANILICEVI